MLLIWLMYLGSMKQEEEIFMALQCSADIKKTGFGGHKPSEEQQMNKQAIEICYAR